MTLGVPSAGFVFAGAWLRVAFVLAAAFFAVFRLTASFFFGVALVVGATFLVLGLKLLGAAFFFRAALFFVFAFLVATVFCLAAAALLVFFWAAFFLRVFFFDVAGPAAFFRLVRFGREARTDEAGVRALLERGLARVADLAFGVRLVPDLARDFAISRSPSG